MKARHRLAHDSWGRANVQMNEEIRKNSEEAAWAGCARRVILQPVTCMEIFRSKKGIRKEKTEFRSC